MQMTPGQAGTMQQQGMAGLWNQKQGRKITLQITGMQQHLAIHRLTKVQVSCMSLKLVWIIEEGEEEAQGKQNVSSWPVDEFQNLDQMLGKKLTADF